jgi:hypothetical protein
MYCICDGSNTAPTQKLLGIRQSGGRLFFASSSHDERGNRESSGRASPDEAEGQMNHLLIDLVLVSYGPRNSFPVQYKRSWL